jgi:hypothetical protein
VQSFLDESHYREWLDDFLRRLKRNIERLGANEGLPASVLKFPVPYPTILALAADDLRIEHAHDGAVGLLPAAIRIFPSTPLL